MAKGQIIKAVSGFYYVLKDGVTYQCKARGLFRKNKQTPLVGDYCLFEADNLTEGYITELLPRKNELIRPPIANIDQALITTSVKEPELNSKLLDRFLVLVEYHNIDPVILFTKMDLVDEAERKTIDQYVVDYEKLGYRVELLSTNWTIDQDVFSSLLKNKTSVIAGQSGVGKSSFLNALRPDLSLETAEISSRLGRGKHTTRHVEMLEVLGGVVADTPGFSSLDFDQIELEQLPFCFRDVAEYQPNCKFRGCMHVNEPKCAVKDAVENGEITEYRYQHYLAFYEEIKTRKPRY